MRYEIWRYSESWKKWIRDVYRSEEDASIAYERFRKYGKRVQPPQPVNKGMPLAARWARLHAAIRLFASKRFDP